MRKRILMPLLAILVILPALMLAQPVSALAGSEKDINGSYKNENFVLKIENFDKQTNSFSFTLNSMKNSGCSLTLSGTAVKLRINYPTPDRVRYEYICADGCKYFFTVITMDTPIVEVMRYGCPDTMMNSCLPEQTSSRMSLESKP